MRFNIFKVNNYSKRFNYFMSRLNFCVCISVNNTVRQKDKNAPMFYFLNVPKTIVFNTLSKERRSDMATQRPSGRSLRVLVLWTLINTGKLFAVYNFPLLATLSSTNLKTMSFIICSLCFISMK